MEYTPQPWDGQGGLYKIPGKIRKKMGWSIKGWRKILINWMAGHRDYIQNASWKYFLP